MNKTPPPLPARRPEAPRTYPVFKLADVMRIIVKDCGGVVVERHGTGTDKVLILPEPAQELVSILSYGRRSPQNFRELKLIGLGHFVLTPDNSRLTLVTHFIQIHTTNRTPSALPIWGLTAPQIPASIFWNTTATSIWHMKKNSIQMRSAALSIRSSKAAVTRNSCWTDTVTPT